jgi:ribonuclease HIII
MKSISSVDIKDVIKLKQFGFKSVDVCSSYELLRLYLDEPKATVIYFSSRKLLIQTSKEHEKKILLLLNKVGINTNTDELILTSKTKEKKIVDNHKNINVIEKDTKEKDTKEKDTKEKDTKEKDTKEKDTKEKFTKEEMMVKEVYSKFSLIIGSDESLKGDTFGGIVVAAVFCDEKIRSKLISLRVCDSKLLDNSAILKIAPEIMKVAPYHFENIYPKDYNKYEMTPLLNRLHKVCFDSTIDLLDIDEKKKINVKHVVDKYPGCKTGDIILEKAESKYIEVAAASIIARYYALMQIEELSKRMGFKIPLGSTHVEHALIMLKKSSFDPNDFVKTSFSNVRRIFNND